MQSLISAAWAAVQAATTAAWNAIVNALRSAMSQMQSAVSTGISQVVSLMASLPGRVVGAVGNLGSLLVGAGSSLVQGLINGITSRIGDAMAAARNLASAVAGAFPGSPVKYGPLKSWNYGGAGKRLAGLLVRGLNDSGQDVRAATERLARAADLGARVTLNDVAAMAARTGPVFKPSAAGSAGAGIGSGQFTFTGPMYGDPREWMREAARELGDTMTIQRLRGTVIA